MPPGVGGPTGTVTFFRNGRRLAVETLTGSGAVLKLKANQALGKTFRVQYSGDSNFYGGFSQTLKVRTGNLATAMVRPFTALISHTRTKAASMDRASVEKLSRALGVITPAYHKVGR